MAGDSEQTLQNHQQPNGGEPFLIGVSGGTASGKVWQAWQAWQAAVAHPPCPGPAAHVAAAVSFCCSHRVVRAPPPRTARLQHRASLARAGRRRGRATGQPGFPSHGGRAGALPSATPPPGRWATRGPSPMGEGPGERILIVL